MLPRLVIANVTPSIDAGRYPVKRVLGEDCIVGADILKDGHDRLDARVVFRPPGEDELWQAAPLVYDWAADRWSGRFPVTQLGRWTFTIEAWTDRFGTWQGAVTRKLEAELDVEDDLLEGAMLLEDVLRSNGLEASANDGRLLAQAAATLRDTRLSPAERAADALAPELARTMALHLAPDDLTRYEHELTVTVDREQARCASWYALFPRSQGTVPGRPGTLADVERRLPDLAALGFDVIYFTPIHPIGRTHRKGPNNAPLAGPDDPGSPWAIGNELGGHTAIDPGLGTLADFDRLVARARSLGMEIALDYAPHCSPDHPWVKEHPDWFFARPDGRLRHGENPPHVFEDIYPLDFWCRDRAALWQACKDVLRFWMAHGVRAFRVDNPHTKPYAFWEWLIAELQREDPGVVFLAEAFTRPKAMQTLAKLGFTQSYTYFTWRSTAAELREYLTELTATEMAEYLRGNLFTNTPDVFPRNLQEGGRPAFRIRLLLAATLSPLYGISSGFELCEGTPLEPGSEEYLDSEKYEIPVRDWQAPGNLNDDIATLNRLRRAYRALQLCANLSFHHSENEQVLFYRKAGPERAGDLLIVVNVDPHHAQETMVHVPLEALGIGADETFAVEDLLSGERYTWRGPRNYVRLDPSERVGQIFRIVEEPAAPEVTP